MAHAIERATGYRVRHGEAVALGMVYVAELARLAGRLDAADAERHESVLASVGLPTRFAGARFEELLATMRVDKKARGSQLRFVVLEGIGRPAVLADPPEELLRAAYDHLAGAR
jgi:3-dehydroquinate synthase